MLSGALIEPTGTPYVAVTGVSVWITAKAPRLGNSALRAEWYCSVLNGGNKRRLRTKAISAVGRMACVGQTGEQMDATR